MKQISAVIITLNEERNIERCLKSLLPIADEIIVVDSLSTDQTQEICEKYDVRFFSRKWEGYAATKNFGNSQSKFPYIFSIDADEELSEELKNSILERKEVGFEGVYSVKRLTNYCGKWIHHLGWYPDAKVRLFPNDQVKWEGDYVHETLHIPLKLNTSTFEGDLLHYSYIDQIDHRERADKYSILTAKKMYAAGKKCSFIQPYLSYLGRFIGMFLIKKGFLEGRIGWTISRISAESNILKYKTLRKLIKSGGEI